MSQRVAKFDPSVGAGSFTIGAVNRCSKLWVVNESPNFMTFDFGGAASTVDIQAFYNQLITLPEPVNMANWVVTDSLQSGSTPVSLVFVRLFAPAEDTSSLKSGPIPRLLNVGNAAAVASATSSVQNDGNPAATTVVEATPVGGGSSQLLLTNQGAATLGGGNAKMDVTGKFTALPAGAVPATSIAAGALPSSVYIGGTGAAAQYAGFGAMNGVAGVSGLQSSGEVDVTGSPVYIKINSYWDGTNDRYITAASAQLFYFDATGLRIRFSTNVATAGGIITWSGYNYLPVMESIGGGAAGQVIYEGTTDPGAGAGEGAVWLPA